MTLALLYIAQHVSDVLTSKHVEQYIIKQVSSSWSTFIQISR